MRISGVTSETDVSPLARLPSLRRITFSDCGWIPDLTVLQQLECLEVIDLSGNEWLEESGLETLKQLRALKVINLTGCSSVIELDALGDLQGIVIRG